MADFYLLGNASRSQMFGCVICGEGHTVVFDGGTVHDGEQMIRFLKETGRTFVDAWFFTHPHHDHVGCMEYLRQKGEGICVKTVYHAFPDLEKGPFSTLFRSEFEGQLWKGIWEWDSAFSVHRVKEGDLFDFGDFKIRVLRTFHPDLVDINNSSTVYRIEGTEKSILILGDLGVPGGEDVKRRCPQSLLKADYTQMAHHGQGGVSKEFYEYIGVKRCIWPTPLWLWNNDRGEGFDTGPYLTVRTREWMDEMGVTEHIVEKDGIQKILI